MSRRGHFSICIFWWLIRVYNVWTVKFHIHVYVKIPAKAKGVVGLYVRLRFCPMVFSAEKHQWYVCFLVSKGRSVRFFLHFTGPLVLSCCVCPSLRSSGRHSNRLPHSQILKIGIGKETGWCNDIHFLKSTRDPLLIRKKDICWTRKPLQVIKKVLLTFGVEDRSKRHAHVAVKLVT